MDNIMALQNYFNTQSLSGNMLSFIGDIFITALLAYILTVVYIRFGNTLSNRNSFANNFILLSLTTMLIITIVKSSLALSLGLVGALSIVRFRAAIKEPEELTYLFLAISIGLGFGASQRYITLVAFITIILIIIGKSLLARRNISYNNMYISMLSKKSLSMEKIMLLLKEYTSFASLKRLEENGNKSELLLLVNFSNVQDLTKLKERLKKIDGHMEITFFEDKGILN